MAYSIQTTKTNVASDVLNYGIYTVNNSLGTAIPYYTTNADLRAIGTQITANPNIMNSFTTALVNQIARVIVQSRTYNNHFGMFRKGINEYGDSVEEAFINIGKSFHFDPEESANGTFMKRELPDVKSVWHVQNFAQFYKVSVSNAELKKAFTSVDALSNFVQRIIEQLYTAMNYDDEQTFKFLLAVQFKESAIPCEVMHGETVSSMLSVLKANITKMGWLSDRFNIAHVKNMGENLYCLVDSYFNAEADVNVLANAFNLPYVDFLPRKIVVDTFVPDVERINMIFDTNYTVSDFAHMENVHIVVCDNEFFQCYDNLIESDEWRNPEGKYINYFMHVWRTYAVSPYAVAFAIDGNDITYSAYTGVKFGTTKAGAISGTSVTNNTAFKTGASTTTEIIVAIPVTEWGGELTPKLISKKGCEVDFVGENVDGKVLIRIYDIKTTSGDTVVTIAPWGDITKTFVIKPYASA